MNEPCIGKGPMPKQTHKGVTESGGQKDEYVFVDMLLILVKGLVL